MASRLENALRSEARFFVERQIKRLANSNKSKSHPKLDVLISAKPFAKYGAHLYDFNRHLSWLQLERLNTLEPNKKKRLKGALKPEN